MVNPSKSHIIAITGGIGAGKSVVAEIVRKMGWECFDCDAEAKDIMDSNIEIHDSLNRLIHPLAVVNSTIDRQKISQVVFSDKNKLKILNGLVHSAVKKLIADRIANCNKNLFFIETAILFESGIDAMVDSIWMVTANEETRISRVIRRSGLTKEDIKRRIDAQTGECHNRTHNLPVITILNDDNTAILPQIQSAIAATLTNL